MRIEESYYGDFKVIDEMAFTIADLIRAGALIRRHYHVRVLNWPVTIDLNQKTGYWEVWFTKPVSDEEYVAFMEPGAQVEEGLRYIQENYG
jgi:hypothetical protein